MSTSVGLLSVAGLVLANAFFVAAEFSLVATRKTRLEAMIQQGDRKAILARRAVQSLTRFISVTQLGITMTSLGLGWIGEPALADLIGGAFAFLPSPFHLVATHAVAGVIAFTAITFLHIILGELVPKAIALAYPETILGWTAGPLMGFRWLMAGPTALLFGVARQLLTWMGVKPPEHHERLHSPEEIRLLVEQSEEGGSLEQADARLLAGVFEFSEKNAMEVMTPRTQVEALAADLTVEQAADEVVRARRSRYPVFRESLDDIVGVVHAKEILAALRSKPGTTVATLMRPPLFVPGTREVEDVLADMKRLKVHMAVVLDEYGGTAGLVTMEDLLEEIVGEILDEYDQAAPAAPPLEGAPLLDGSMPISDLNAEYDLSLDDREYTTLGGYIFGQLGRLPRAGDRVTVAGDTFEVVEMEGKRVKSVRFLQGAAGKT
ncbi:MAG TPA: hemolysin family protein [Gemmatimonadales bacterium]|jgi:CBS domain containing-hemolysin-like protein|nr:hemolysin family protein [Gemmatimonadales bacterium]